METRRRAAAAAAVTKTVWRSGDRLFTYDFPIPKMLREFTAMTVKKHLTVRGRDPGSDDLRQLASTADQMPEVNVGSRVLRTRKREEVPDRNRKAVEKRQKAMPGGQKEVPGKVRVWSGGVLENSRETGSLGSTRESGREKPTAVPMLKNSAPHPTTPGARRR
ncbi:UNVERIFIED_CONTAM: hypothetical protein PYX00_005066 [Menopon gallinae]|uniref:Uncharacterized protein n=1 Tax=Menopon gallinae TaxID=328185 RepID=A0AAW2HPU0_9NEOP